MEKVNSTRPRSHVPLFENHERTTHGVERVRERAHAREPTAAHEAQALLREGAFPPFVRAEAEAARARVPVIEVDRVIEAEGFVEECLCEILGDDHGTARDPTDLGDERVRIGCVVQDVHTECGIEVAVGEREVLAVEEDRWASGGRVILYVHVGDREPTLRARPRLKVVRQVPVARAEVQDLSRIGERVLEEGDELVGAACRCGCFHGDSHRSA